MKTPKKHLKTSKQQTSNKNRKTVDMSNRHGRLGFVNAKNPNDRLEILKAKCEQEIHDAEEKLRVLKAKLANLIMFTHESEKLENPAAEPDKYSKLGYTEAILKSIQSLWDARKIPVTATQIKNDLIAHGFKCGSSFEVSVYTILTRLTQSGRIAAVEHGRYESGSVRIPGRKGYKPK